MLTRINERKPLTVDPLFFSRVLQRAGNALLKEVNYYGLPAIDLEDLQGVPVAAIVVRSWDQNVPNYLGPVCWVGKLTAVHARSSTSSREVRGWCCDYHFPICYSNFLGVFWLGACGFAGDGEQERVSNSGITGTLGFRNQG